MNGKSSVGCINCYCFQLLHQGIISVSIQGQHQTNQTQQHRRNDSAMMNMTLTDVNDSEPIWTTGHDTHFDIFEVCVESCVCGNSMTVFV